MDKNIKVHVAGVVWPFSPGPAAFGWIAERNGVVFNKSAVYVGSATTQTAAEYIGIISALSWMAKMSKVLSIQKNPIKLTLIPVVINTDNLMITRHLTGQLKANPPFVPMCQAVKSMMEMFRIIQVCHVPKLQTEPAADLARGVLTGLGHKPGLR